MQPLFRLSSTQLFAALGVLALIGCNTGSRGGSGGGTTPPTNVTVNAVTIQNVNSAVVGQANGVNALIFQLVNPSTTESLTLNSVTITVSGTANDPAMITTVTLREDVDASATISTGDVQLAQSGSPAFAADNGTVLLTVTPGRAVPANTTRQYIVTYETIANVGSTTHVGQTITFSVAGASSIGLVGTGTTTVSFTGLPATGDTVTQGISDHLLITEVQTANAAGTSAEFIEVYNPTGSVIDLNNVHLSDFTSGAANSRYDVLPTAGATTGVTPANATLGVSRADGLATDFSARFPNATIGPGTAVTIAVDATLFMAAYGTAPTFALRNGATPPAGFQLMRTWDGVPGNNSFIDTTPGIAANSVDMLPASGEPVYLYMWDGSVASPSDLVTDYDIVVYGGVALITGADIPTTKASVAQDGVDTGTTTTTYPAETAPGTQNANRIGSASPVFRRINFLEGAQTATGGNGVGGNDETSEVWSSTFQAFTTATPGTP